MKKSICIILASLLAAASVGTFVFASNATTESTAKEPAKVKFNVNLTDEEKDELNAVVSEKLLEIYGKKLENEEITEEEYALLTEALESGDFMKHGFRDFSEKPGNGGGMMKMKGKAPENFVTNGFEKHEKSEMTDEQKAAMTEKIKEQLSELLESEKITEDEYNEYLAALENGDFSFFGALRKMPDAKAEKGFGRNGGKDFAKVPKGAESTEETTDTSSTTDELLNARENNAHPNGNMNHGFGNGGRKMPGKNK